MARRIARYGVLLAMLLIGLLLCLDVAAFVHGSFEQFPTDEQAGKARLVTGALAALLVVAEASLWSVLGYLSRDAASHERTTDGSSAPGA